MTEDKSIPNWRRRTLVVMGVVLFAMSVVGLRDTQPMIGDEVTHYYMAVTQASQLPGPNIRAEIPLGDGTIEKRTYPHVFLWHYLGGIVSSVSGGSFRAVELYHLLYMLQFLVVLRLAAKREEGGDTAASFLFVLLVATLPLTLIFGVAMYQDIPAAAQCITAMWLLRTRRYLLSALVFGVGLAIKISLAPIAPMLLVLMLIQEWRQKGPGRAILTVVLAASIMVATCVPMARAIKAAGGDYYLTLVVQECREAIKHVLEPPPRSDATPTPKAEKKKADDAFLRQMQKEQSLRQELSTTPGDIRALMNIPIYAGGMVFLLGLLVLAAVVGRRRMGPESGQARVSWAYALVGVWTIVLTGFHMRTAPDIRFFLPGLVMLLLPLSQCAIRLPGRRVWLPAMVLIGIIQATGALYKVHELRHVRIGLWEVIDYLRENPPQARKVYRPDINVNGERVGREKYYRVDEAILKGSVFMYPEGNYRLFPSVHEWYMNNTLREFWKTDNTTRIRRLNLLRVGYVLIKKYRVGEPDPDMSNLGIYPSFFVEQIDSDPRFEKVLENHDVILYRVPLPELKEWDLDAFRIAPPESQSVAP